MQRAKRNRSYIYYGVGLVILGLIGVQVFWISNSIKLQKVAIERRLKEDVDQVVKDVEEQAYCFTVFSKAYVKRGEGVYMVKQGWNTSAGFEGNPDTMNLYNVFPTSATDTVFFNERSLSFGSYPATVDVTMKFSFVGANPLKRYDSASYQLGGLSANNFKEVLSNKYGITENIDMDLLDELIKSTLKKNKLDTFYEVGIRKEGNGDFEFLSNGASVKHLSHATVKAGLLINKFSKPYELLLYVPDSFRAVLRSLAVMVVSSIIIIVLLVFAYAYFVRTILNQKRLSDMKNIFINNITHEFRTPITNISLAVENWHDNNGKAGTYMGIIDEENKHIERNVEQILQLATLESGKGPRQFSNTNIHELITEAITTFNMQMQNTGGEIITAYNAATPYIQCNREQIMNMLQNLIDNAIKYREGLPHIVISTYLASNRFVIQVEDNGIGMSSDTQKYIFERFYRGHSGDRHDVKGFGLGLSYVKYIVDAHNGEIHVKSKPGKGTKFTIYLPQNPEA